MALATIVLLSLMTGSLVVPLKAIALNVLSLSAAFGIIVWVFQEGHLQWLVGDFQVTGYVVSNMPLLLLCIAFGLSMDAAALGHGADGRHELVGSALPEAALGELCPWRRGACGAHSAPDRPARAQAGR